MYNDVIDLRDFYSSPLGLTTQRIVRRYVRNIWPDTRGMNIAGVGYPTPYLRPFIGNTERVVALMPAQQGALKWPAEEGNIVSLVLEEGLPLPDVSVDRVLMIHSLEYSDQARKLLREVWRVMTEGGRVLIVVPNRRGIWARIDHTPFGHGQPFTAAQMSRLLRNNLFQPECWSAGLFVPPTRSRMILASANPIERLGYRWFQAVGGLLFVEAQKQIYAATGKAQETTRERRYARVVGGSEHKSTYNTYCL
ncbi:MAG: class I SAM-dependent methyltransferase [Pseudomonadota bacterium]|nr:class I SAM-dependent methyltransferase [Pseudomonadota bacterium]